MNVLRRFVLIFVCAWGVLLLFSKVAYAQATIIVANEQSLPRVDEDGKPLTKRAPNLEPEQVSLLDCRANQRIRLAITMNGFAPNGSLQVWASLGGIDCKQQTNRSSATQQCWNVITGLPLVLNQNVDIPVRKIMAGVPPSSPINPSDDISICGKIDLATIGLQILYFAPGQLAQPVGHKDISIIVDTVGPPPPSGLRVLPGNNRLTVRWDNISGEGGVTQLAGLKVYCQALGDPDAAVTTTTTNPGTSTTTDPVCTEVDAGPDADASIVCDDGGTETTDGSVVETNTSCGSDLLSNADGTPLIPGIELDPYQCGSFFGVQGTQTSAEEFTDEAGAKTRLQNGVKYAIAVAGTDALQNVGALSKVICEVPEETNDFWKNYKTAGGDAGGCATSPPNELPYGTLAMFGLGLVTIGRIVRNRKRSARR